jgi:DNA-binding transcriptional ArsR family regulator
MQFTEQGRCQYRVTILTLRYNTCMEAHMYTVPQTVEPNLDDCEVACVHPPAVFAARAALAAMPPAPEVAGLFALLADPTRLRLLAALASGELCVCDLAAATGINRTTVSHQLRTLRQGRVVRSRRAGRVIFYALDDDHVRELLVMGTAHAGESLARVGTE